jgi:hypothetical protein
MLNYDVVQNKRVFDNQVKHVASMNEIASAPKKSDIEFEASVRQRVESLILAFQQLTNQVGNMTAPRGPTTAEIGVGTSDAPAPAPAPAPEEDFEEEETKEPEGELKESKEEEDEPVPKKPRGRPAQTKPADMTYEQIVAALKKATSKKQKEELEKEKAEREEQLEAEFFPEGFAGIEFIGEGRKRRMIHDDEEMSGGMVMRQLYSRMRGGIITRQEDFSLSLSRDRMESAISTIYSQFNALVDFINAKINVSGYSDQQRNNIYVMLEPIIDACKNSLLAIVRLRSIDESLYNRSYNLLYEIIQNIQNSPPLMRLDVTKIRDAHYVRDDSRSYEDYKQIEEKYKGLLERYAGDIPKELEEATRIMREKIPKTLKMPTGAVIDKERAELEIELLGEKKNDLINIALSETLTREQQSALENEINNIDRKIGSLKNKIQNIEAMKGRGRGRKSVAENSAVKAQKVSNARAKKQQERFNAEAPDAWGPPTYRGLKPDNTLGTLGSGRKKNIKMKKTDFVKEHNNLISMLGKTAKKLKSEATEQLQELSAIDKEKAMALNKVIDGVQMKERAKGRGKKSMKLPVLSFDDKKNDWYL